MEFSRAAPIQGVIDSSTETREFSRERDVREDIPLAPIRLFPGRPHIFF
jgi:hypothetical protein